MSPFHGWGSTASRLEPLRGGSILFTTKFPETSGTQFIELRRMKGWVGSHPVVLNMGPLDWESSALTTRPLLHKSHKRMPSFSKLNGFKKLLWSLYLALNMIQTVWTSGITRHALIEITGLHTTVYKENLKSN